MATQVVVQGIGPTSRSHEAMRPMPSLPSPTLTNPDMVLPDEPSRFPSLPSPPRHVWRARPPSPSYLRDKASDTDRQRSGSGGSAMMTPKKEKRGLMSRKMMLLRSRTASSGVQVTGSQSTPRSVPSEHSFEDFGSAYGSSPTLMDVGNLAPEPQEQTRTSAEGSSIGSDDLAAIPQFLARYGDGSIGTEDEREPETRTSQEYGNSVSIEGGMQAQRRQQEEEEHNSAILSQRAEQILANAKKRLNLMEGNLRGARDLVTPLTSANLKRATSVGSSYMTTGASHTSRGRRGKDGRSRQHPDQTLHALYAQASSPNIGRDYQQGHWRNFSATQLPDRPHTAMDATASPIIANGRIPTKAHDPSWANALRGSRSYDSLGAHNMRRSTSRDQNYPRASPDPTLEPLVEDDGYEYDSSTRRYSRKDHHEGLGIWRSPSRTDDLREQMSSLKGKISTLRERAKEDSLRRQSIQNLREPSPLNNAAATAPEFFYTSSQAYGTPGLDANAGIGWTSPSNSPETPKSTQKLWESSQVFTGSRNAFGEEALRMQQQGAEREGSPQSGSQKSQQDDAKQQRRSEKYSKARGSSRAAAIQASKRRYSHHQFYHASDGSADRVSGDSAHSSPRPESTTGIGLAVDGFRRTPSGEESSETGETVYEDAESEASPSVVAHEDREDAFDYESFFLHSAMSAYGVDGRRASVSSEDTTSSTETARGPTLAGTSELEEDEEEEDDSPPPSPETPEKLKVIERNLHKRTFSDESVSTVATFATATEGRDSPVPGSKRTSILDWPIRTENPSRPSTAIQINRPSTIARSDSSSERADSGIGLPHRPHSSQSHKRPALRSIAPGKSAFSPSAGTMGSAMSPPMSPRTQVDPATVAVQALLAPNARQLGLKDKALLFSLIESLTKVCYKLQEGEEADHESRMLRRRLDEARRVLDGNSEGRPGTS